MNEKKNILKDKSFVFAIRIVKLYEYLCDKKREFVLSKQLLRRGTAIGALIREAQNGASKADVIHKLSIAQKECDESIYWIEVLNKTDYINLKEFESINDEANVLLKMIRSAIITTKKNLIHNS